jgi:hypothetical protein
MIYDDLSRAVKYVVHRALPEKQSKSVTTAIRLNSSRGLKWKK